VTEKKFDTNQKNKKSTTITKFKAQFSIKQISRDGIVTLGVSAQEGSTELIGEFYNSSLSVQLISREI
jgi:hypothetical protein